MVWKDIQETMQKIKIDPDVKRFTRHQSMIPIVPKAKAIYRVKSKDVHKRRGLLKFELDFLREEKIDIVRNFHIVEALYKEAVTLGIIPLKNPLDGIEVDLRIARVVNSV